MSANLTTPDEAVIFRPRPVECGFVEAARQRVEEMRGWEAEEIDPPSVPELEAVLNQPVKQCALIGENWRNKVFRLELKSGTAALAKQVVMATAGMLQYQHDQLLQLANLDIPGLWVPKPLGLMREKRVLLMEFAHGETIEALVWDSRRESELTEACQLAGRILAQVEAARTERIDATPIDSLSHDLSLAPWSLTKRQQAFLSKAFARLAEGKMRLGEVYYDYKPANLLYENTGLALIDPPDHYRSGVMLWDYACFRNSMRCHLWRLSLRRPSPRRQALIRRSMLAFQASYLASVGQPDLDPALFAIAVQLLELQRTAVLTTMQHGMVELARQRRPIAAGRRLGGLIGNRMTLPLLELEKRWLFMQLSRMLR